VHGQTGAPRMITARGVDEQNLRPERKRTYGGLEKGTFAQSEQPRHVVPTGGPGGYFGCNRVAISGDGRRRPSVVGRVEARKAGADEKDVGVGAPRRSVGDGEILLGGDEVALGCRPFACHGGGGLGSTKRTYFVAAGWRAQVPWKKAGTKW
jgi:hypothetical protein